MDSCPPLRYLETNCFSWVITSCPENSQKKDKLLFAKIKQATNEKKSYLKFN